MLTRDFVWKTKALSEEGAFEGIASPYGDPPDLLGDVIEPGAYAQAIRQQGKGFPLLWSHRQDEPLGLAKIQDSLAGLIVHGKLLLDDPAAQRAQVHLRAGSIKGLSIGYTVPKGEGKVSIRDDGARVLKEIHLHEISIVAVPAAPRAQITTVKTLGDVRHLLKRFQNVDEETFAELSEIDRELKRLLLASPLSQERAETLAELKRFAEEIKMN